jgi:hypothetical protein
MGSAMATIAFRGLAPAPPRRAHGRRASDTPPQGEGESDEAYKKRKQEAEEDKRRDGETDEEWTRRVNKNKRRRAQEKRDERAADDDDDGDDDTDREDEASAAALVCRVKARVGAILGHPNARANLQAALRLALGTSLPRSEACSLLASLPAPPAGGGLADRMAQYGGQRPGAGAVAADPRKTARTAWDTAMKSARTW